MQNRKLKKKIEELTKCTFKKISPLQSQKICKELSSELPEWFGIPEANERYAKGVLECVSFSAEIENTSIGMISLEFPFVNNANIFWMAIKKEYHGKGIAFQLLEVASKYCVNKGCQSLTVETLSPKHNDTNYLKTYHFYLKCGFKPLFELHPYDPELTMCYLLKQLT